MCRGRLIFFRRLWGVICRVISSSSSEMCEFRRKRGGVEDIMVMNWYIGLLGYVGRVVYNKDGR